MEIPRPVIEIIPIADLKEWSKNPRKRHAVDAISKSIEKFGYLNPIIVQRGTNRVLAGHGRLKALFQQGARLVPVIVADINDRQADAFTIADNQIGDQSEFDLAGLSDLFKGMDQELRCLTGFSDRQIKNIERQLSPDAEVPAPEGSNTTLFLTFASREQYKEVKAEIRRIQAGTEMSAADVIYEKFFPGKS